MIYTHKVSTNNIPRSPTTLTQFKKPSARKSMCIFTNILDVKKKTAILQVGAAKSKSKAIKAGTTKWALKPNRKGNSKSIIR